MSPTHHPLQGKLFLFATRDAMLKRVPGEEFETNNRMVAATKLQEGDSLVSVQPADEASEVVLQTDNGVFLRFAMDEISVQKKNARGVRGIKLGRGEALEQVYLLGANTESVITYERKAGASEPSEARDAGMERETRSVSKRRAENAKIFDFLLYTMLH